MNDDDGVSRCEKYAGVFFWEELEICFLERWRDVGRGCNGCLILVRVEILDVDFFGERKGCRVLVHLRNFDYWR